MLLLLLLLLLTDMAMEMPFPSQKVSLAPEKTAERPRLPFWIFFQEKNTGTTQRISCLRDPARRIGQSERPSLHQAGPSLTAQRVREAICLSLERHWKATFVRKPTCAKQRITRRLGLGQAPTFYASGQKIRQNPFQRGFLRAPMAHAKGL